MLGPIVGKIATKTTDATTEATASPAIAAGAAEQGEHEEPHGERDERRPRVRPEEPGVRERARGDRPVPRPRCGEQQAHGDERVRGRERAQERRDQPADGALLVGVEDPVLREAREAAIREAELLREPVGHAGVPPPLERHEVDVDQPPGREPAAHCDDRQPDPAPPDPVERDEPPERVGAERKQVVAERVQLALGRRAAVEPRLGQQPVEDDQRAVRKREPVGPDELRQRPHRPDRGDEGDDQHDLLPRGRDVERGVADPRLPEERHREVVEREPDDEDDQRHPGKAGGHVVATSVMPRL